MALKPSSKLAKLEECKIDSGSFNSANQELETLNSRIEEGLAELDRGDYVDGESFMQKLLDYLDQRIAADTNQ